MNIDEINTRIEEIKGNDSLTPGAKEALIRSWEAVKNSQEKNPAPAPEDPKPGTDLGTFEEYHAGKEEVRKKDPSYMIEYERIIEERKIKDEEQKKKMIEYLDRQREKEDKKKDYINWLLLKDKERRDEEARKAAEAEVKAKAAEYEEQLRQEYRKKTGAAEWTDFPTDKAWKEYTKNLSEKMRKEQEKHLLGGKK